MSERQLLYKSSLGGVFAGDKTLKLSAHRWSFNIEAMGRDEITKRVNVEEGKETIRRVGGKEPAKEAQTSEQVVRQGKNQKCGTPKGKCKRQYRGASKPEEGQTRWRT